MPSPQFTPAASVSHASTSKVSASSATPLSSTTSLYSAMAHMIGEWTEGKEDCSTRIENLAFFRREQPMPPAACMVEPSLVMVVQGAKELLIGHQGYTYDTGRFLINSLYLPATSQVLEASREQPCLGLMLRLDLGVLAELTSQVQWPSSRDRVSVGESAALGTMTPDLLEPFERLIRLNRTPEDIGALAPLIEREIHYRLLKSDLSSRLWQFVAVGNQRQRIARAIDWLRLHFTEPLSVEALASHVQMSTSSLHHYFRQLTAKSPLQYQKWLRLSEARRLMLNEGMEAARAAYQVGYESPSQFSREYSRQFGAPPKRDIEHLRQHMVELPAH